MTAGRHLAGIAYNKKLGLVQVGGCGLWSSESTLDGIDFNTVSLPPLPLPEKESASSAWTSAP